MVAATIERCPRQMMLRELVMNALEAAAQATDAPKRVLIDALVVNGAPKLRIWNTGRGLSQTELLQISDLSSSLFKTVSLDGNFGMGAKAASLSSNKEGLRYRSCRLGKVSQIVLGAREGVYGRLLQLDAASGARREAIDVTDAAAAAGEDVSHDWTEVTLFGNTPEQDTAADPYAGNPALPRDWVVQVLGRRFVRLPEGVDLTIDPSASGSSAPEAFVPPLAAASFDRLDSVKAEGGIVLHYGYRAKDSALPPPRVKTIGLGAVVYNGEVYALTEDRRWALEAPTYGFTFAAKQCSVIVELPPAFAARPEQYRQFLRFTDGDQHQVQFADFGDLVRRSLPTWLKRIISSLSPAESDYLTEIRDEMRHLLAELGIEDLLRAPQSPKPRTRNPEAPAPNETRSDQPRPPEKRPEAPSPPEIIAIEDEAEIVEKALGGRAARYYPAARQVFVNTRYTAFARMRAQLAEEYGPFADEETIARVAKQTAERTIIQRVARTLLHSIGKPKAGWSVDEVKAVQSPEALSLMIDDIDPLMVSARRRMAVQLGLEAETEGHFGGGPESAQRREAAEIADAEAQLQRAMAGDVRSLGRYYRQISAVHLRQRNYPAARAWLEKGMETDPADAACRHDYAGVLMSLNDLDGAARAADEAIAMTAGASPWFRRRRAEVEIRRGDRRKAEAMLQALAEEDPSAPWPHYDLAQLHLTEGNFDAATHAMETAMQRSPAPSAMLVKRSAEIEWRRGDVDSARKLFEQALALEPGDAGTRLTLARFDLADGRHEEAVRKIDAALELRPPSTAPFHRLRSELEMQRGERGAALAAALKAVRVDPTDHASRTHLAGIYQAIGDLNRAAEEAAEAARLAATPSPAILRRQADIELRRNNPQGALKLLEEALEAAPNDPATWLGISSQRLSLNDLPGADEAAATASTWLSGPARLSVLRRRSGIASRRGDLASARAFLNEAMDLAPRDPWCRLDFANLLVAEGDLENAAVKAREAISVSGAPNAVALCRLASIEQRRGRLEAARRYLQQAAAVDPKDAQPWSMLSSVLSAAGDLPGAREAAEKAVLIASGNREGLEALLAIAS